MDVVIVVVVLALVVVFVSAPFRRTPALGSAGANGAGQLASARASDIAELEAAREAKYREIRDADLDHRTGKLSDADYEAIDGSLRAEAIDILHRLDSINGR